MSNKYVVRIDFKGSLEVEIEADPEDTEEWTDALSKVWSRLKMAMGYSFDPHALDIQKYAEMCGHEILSMTGGSDDQEDAI